MPPCEALDVMDKTHYNRAMRVAPGNRHAYIVGAQHTVDTKRLPKTVKGNQDKKNLYNVPHGTVVYALMSPLHYEHHFAHTTSGSLNSLMDEIIKSMCIQL
eukprot:gnl/Chilomastix_caulleri/3940.p1 GENE.gnl/Chilomastix_caulleri/3940~~gnl/Chilomastix_caulleri/3940.p1  ORF type:complete len:101 (+),score=22.96 gnl/Chilomastix_caulleri/3940:149-451(+)